MHDGTVHIHHDAFGLEVHVLVLHIALAIEIGILGLHEEHNRVGRLVRHWGIKYIGFPHATDGIFGSCNRIIPLNGTRVPFGLDTMFFVEPAFDRIELLELGLCSRIELMNCCGIDGQWWQGIGGGDDGVVNNHATNITKALRHGNHHAKKQQQYVDFSIQIVVGLHSKCKGTTK